MLDQKNTSARQAWSNTSSTNPIWGDRLALHGPRKTLQKALMLNDEECIKAFDNLMHGRSCNLQKAATFASQWNRVGKEAVKSLFKPAAEASARNAVMAKPTEDIDQYFAGSFENAFQEDFAWIDEIDKCASRLANVDKRISMLHTPPDHDIGKGKGVVIDRASGAATAVRRALSKAFVKGQLNTEVKLIVGLKTKAFDWLRFKINPEQMSARQERKLRLAIRTVLKAVEQYNEKYPQQAVKTISMKPAVANVHGLPRDKVANILAQEVAAFQTRQDQFQNVNILTVSDRNMVAALNAAFEPLAVRCHDLPPLPEPAT